MLGTFIFKLYLVILSPYFLVYIYEIKFNNIILITKLLFNLI